MTLYTHSTEANNLKVLATSTTELPWEVTWKLRISQQKTDSFLLTKCEIIHSMEL